MTILGDGKVESDHCKRSPKATLNFRRSLRSQQTIIVHKEKKQMRKINSW